MKVERINLDGELGIVNSARVSFGAWKNELEDKDRKLIEYLRKHNHKSPFFHPQYTFQFAGTKSDWLMFFLKTYDKLSNAGVEMYENFFRISYYNLHESKAVEGKKSCWGGNYTKYWKEIDDLKLLDGERGMWALNLDFDEKWLLNQEDLFKASRLPYLSFRIKAPIFVIRQLEKHQVGLVKNERSGRYVEFDCEFYIPEKWRKKSPSNKQGSLQDKFVNQIEILMRGLINKETLNLKQKFILFCLKILQKDLFVRLSYEKILEMQEKWYHANIENEMCGEQARMILPLATFTEFVWTGSLQDYARICSLRLKLDSQKETRDLGEMIYNLCKAEYPNTFDKLIELHNDN
jgi:thymidylate synthase (FAD)